jgi:hypothetical protein
LILSRETIRHSTVTFGPTEKPPPPYIAAWNEGCQPLSPGPRTPTPLLAEGLPPKNRKTHTTFETRH